ncbi:MAG: TonB-dependent receptor [Crocinitomicaceae bacterium]|nr:TonB-dependent receptor [Crocinitomicaceae bacterium]
MKYYLVALVFWIVSYSAFSQDEKQLEELNIIATKLNKYYVDSINVYISRKDIEALQPDDLGELLKKLPGVNVKSYGGLGGLKTVSIRGLSGQHTSFVVDGFSQTNAQTGQINMGQVQLDNIESIVVQRGGTSELKIPTIAQLSGNAIVLESFQAKAPTIPFQQKLITKFGSFGQNDYTYIGKTGKEKLFGGIYFKYRSANGEYPFKYMNYKTQLSGIRKNNDFTDINSGFNLSYQPVKNHTINFQIQYSETHQGVPGAVVLYNDLAKQRLNTTNLQIKADYNGKVKAIGYRFYYSFMNDSLHYNDPDYLNITGELIASYRNKSHDAGFSMGIPLGKYFQFNTGVQEIISNLHSVESLNASPARFHFLSFAKTSFHAKKWNAVAQIGLQNIAEINRNGEKAPNRTRVNPFVEVRYHVHKNISLIAFYRNSFRMPNFSELYYNNIGNNNLKPEDAHQINLTTSYTIVDKNNIYLGLQASGYYQHVDNLILAIPTKNLFVWSIQNIGKNEVKGADAILSFSWSFGKHWSTQLTANYTFQQSLDLSDKNSPSYKQQVAYNPLHIVNGDFSISYRGIGIRYSNFYSSERYALNQNIPANRIDGFWISDLTLFSKFNIDKHNSVRFQFTIKNISDASYAYVKSFIMPGRHYLFTFVYEFI